MANKPLIILDRDGVINHDPHGYIKSVKDWHPIAGSLEAIAKASMAGCAIAVASNQSGVARGYFDEQALAAIHNHLQQRVSNLGGIIDKIYYCPHHPNSDCDCRKPKPGLLLQALDYFAADLQQTYFIGDSIKDVEAGIAAGCHSVLVRTGNGSKTEAMLDSSLAVSIFNDLSEAIEWILSDQH